MIRYLIVFFLTSQEQCHLLQDKPTAKSDVDIPQLFCEL